jgi:hypothetical protein
MVAQYFTAVGHKEAHKRQEAQKRQNSICAFCSSSCASLWLRSADAVGAALPDDDDLTVELFGKCPDGGFVGD